MEHTKFKKAVATEWTVRPKILACYPHVSTSSIYKMVGCHRRHVYNFLRKEGLPVLKNKDSGYYD